MYCNRIYNPYKTHCYFPRLILEALNVFKDSLNYTILTFFVKLDLFVISIRMII